MIREESTQIARSAVGVGALAIAAPLAASVLLAFASGGYFIRSWGVAALVLLGVLALLVLAQARIVGGSTIGLALGGWGLFALWQGASAWWANEPIAAQTAMGLTLLYATVFALGALGIQRVDWLRFVSVGTLIATWVPVSTALAARLFPDQVGGDNLARLTWPITYWNGLGALAAFGLLLGIGLAGSPDLDRIARAVALASTPVFGLTLYLTQSRGAILVALVMLGVLVAIGPSRLETILATVLGCGTTAVLAALAEREGGLSALGGTLPEHAAQGRIVGLWLGVSMVVLGGAASMTGGTLAPLSKTWRRRIGVSLGVLAAVVAVTGWTVAGPAQNPISWADTQLESFKSFDVGARTDDSVAGRLAVAAGSGRWQNWSVALDQWQTAPATGTGAGDYRFEWNERRDLPLDVVNAHSLYLEVAGESGLIGLLLLGLPLAVTALTVWRVLRRRRGDAVARDVAVAACAAGLIALHAAGDWDWQLTAVTVPAVLLGGACLGAAVRAGGEAPGRGWAMRAATLVMVAIAGLMIVGPTGSAIRSADARELARDGNLALALNRARDAERLAPNATDPLVLQAQLLTDLGRPDAADVKFAEALRHSPKDWEIMADWAAALIHRGDRSGADLLLTRAAQLNPRDERVAVLQKQAAATP